MSFGMLSVKKYLISILVFLTVTFSIAGSILTAVPFVGIHPGPNLNAMAGAFTALPTTDAFGAFFNPAQLGNFARERNFSVQFYPSKTIWQPGFKFENLTFQSRAVALGYNLQELTHIPLSIGAGYIGSKLDLGRAYQADNYGNIISSFDSWQSYDAYSLGLGLDYFIRFNLGYTFKNIHSKLDEGTEVFLAEDLGLQLTVPLTESLKPLARAALPEAYSPSFDFSLGLTLANHDRESGLRTLHKGAGQLPKQARMGYAFSFGLDRQYHGFDIQTLRLDWSSEARNVLVQDGPDPAFPGKIKIWDNIIQGKSTAAVAVHQGWRIKIYDTLQYSRGWFKGGGFPTSEKSYGFMIGSAGLLKYLTANSSSTDLKYAATHFELNYVFTRYSSSGPRNGTEFQGLSLSVRGF